MHMINVVDIFAGPGGLGEGFARYSPSDTREDRPFRVVLSAEKDPAAVRTLRLRKFYHLCETASGVPDSYYDYLRGDRAEPFDQDTEELWARACAETKPLELGTSSGDAQLGNWLRDNLEGNTHWVLIGGPPCQAYSLAGRSRNKGVHGYAPEQDDRHFLYQHYLRILAEYEPAVFIMENVKGILTSQVGGELIFPTILRDLSEPGRAIQEASGVRYHILPLSSTSSTLESRDARDFVVRAENHGVPQARHRVILLGIREDLQPGPIDGLHRGCLVSGHVKLDPFLKGLPPVRSGTRSGTSDNAAWAEEVVHAVQQFASQGLSRRWKDAMLRNFRARAPDEFPHGCGGPFVPHKRNRTGQSKPQKKLFGWLNAPRLGGFVNHEARSHMSSDLVRYLFASTFAHELGHSPSAREFPAVLAPMHRNWHSGAFADRFRVQAFGKPSTTITSHISKDGHYYIHPDSSQCRSLTVREAARLQTFPDDYLFEGNRTEQYVQVGNAVPPFLARQVADIVHKLLLGGTRRSSPRARKP